MQNYRSAGTSQNQVPAIIKYLEKHNEFKDGMVVLDYGGGKYDKTRKTVEGTYNVKYLVYDPYNRSKEHNKAALAQKADIVILSNVLNVIREPEERQRVLRHIKTLMNPGASLYISTYNAPKSDLYTENPYPGQPTKGGTCWQNCQQLSFYIPEVRRVLPRIRKHNGILLAQKKGVSI